MKKSEFSETQFLVAYLREMLPTSHGFWIKHFFRIPSTVMEIQSGADLILTNKKTKGSKFYQFKRSTFLSSRRGLRASQRMIDKDFFPCYRFRIYNDYGSEQFDRLKRLARRRKNICMYVAPIFHTYEEFDRLFPVQEIGINSAIIEIAQFNDPQFVAHVGDTHYLLFNGDDGYCFFCSKLAEAKVAAPDEISSRMREFEETSFEEEMNAIIAHVDNHKVPVKDINQAETLSQKAKLVTDHLFFNFGTMWVPNFQ